MTIKNDAAATAETASSGLPHGRAHDAPGVLVFPPLVFLGFMLCGLLLQAVWPAPFSFASWARVAGAFLMAAGASLAMWGRATMVRAGTNVFPNKPALTIVTNGPFRFTRNPLYVGNAAFYTGLGLLLNAVWSLALFVPMLLVLYWGVIRREERYLEAKFGPAYLTYKARVRRWL